MKKKIKIISTLGPNSLNPQFLAHCQKSDQLYFRLNGSHLSETDLRLYIEFVHKFIPDEHIELYLDLQGSKIRIGDFPAPISLSPNQQLSLVLNKLTKTLEIPLPQPEFFSAIEENDTVILQDGEIHLIVLKKQLNNVLTQVKKAGVLKPRSGVHIQNKKINIDKMAEEQLTQIRIANEFNIDSLALSYLKNADEMTKLKRFCEDMHYTPKIVAKIENPSALEQLQQISNTANEIWFCRGDLGTTIPLKELGYWQDITIQTAHHFQKSIIIAGQVFHHLTYHKESTRSEVVHFYHILKQNIDGIVLSDETTYGDNPLRAHAKIVSLL